jgi:hypothetical protein
MKKISKLLMGCLLVCSLTVVAESNQSDQKWLDAVQKMVAKGATEVSTPSQDRAKLLKEWAGKRGYSVEVTKTEAGFRVVVSKSLAKN